ncbi:MAG: DGQHR domain-containing protein, partial [Ekhidna sp.]|nr:DGQHR domain-containing protein [Ekhidna sp.]
MGDWIYYVTFMSFRDIKEWIQAPHEIHSSKKLSEWIQRELQLNHAQAIATYLATQPERMFNALFVGIYDGEPQWGEIQVSSTLELAPFEVTEDQLDNLSRSIGILHFSGEEKLFAIDGQHRVAGVKLALEKNKDLLKDDEITVILVGHKTDQTGRERTRRLFTTLNKTAKRVSQTDIIALDEDNGAAIVTRRMIDDFTLFLKGEMIAFNPTANIGDSDLDSITSVITLYDIVKTLVGCVDGTRGFTNNRPDDDLLNSVYNFCCSYWNSLKEIIPEYNEVFLFKKSPSQFRQPDNNHLLFRPVGQRAFTEAIAHLIKNYSLGLDEAIKELSQVDLWLHSLKWHYILWNPIGKTMKKKKKNRG